MKQIRSTTIAVVAGTAAAATAFVWSAMADQAPAAPAISSNLETAIFAGGCFWCTEADFDKVEGVVSTTSGYTGGTTDNPAYREVTAGGTGHYEAVKVAYDPAEVSYTELVDYYFRTIDPTDPSGQFCDKGPSYRTAIFVADAEERSIAENEIRMIEASGQLPGPVVTKVLEASEFWPAEDFHQNYYRTNPIRYKFYRQGCGRDDRLKMLWGEDAAIN